ncbi:kinase-like protein [Westerdykella ornata]|uniref:Kinase-like protein n=1 Tax=Westerdykella ornata TaxID=318751 RepID=A0A6A6JE21_WESOR|nr:kinase-like protein [Westerdykella ornata]KAF2274662.1 kinase-like protein [Westerdykella ornata]
MPSLFAGVQSLRLRNLAASPSPELMSMAIDPSPPHHGFLNVFKKKIPPHSSHPNFANLTLLVFEAVLEVVCVSLPGYIIARMGMFDAENQKFLANLNTQLFTPFFTKLASQLSANKLAELGVIPFIFVVQMLVSFLTAILVSKICGFRKRAKNFVVAMAVFGNSNSLPISLVISLSQTLSGLHWDRIPGDNDNEVAARGILYLLIFQQLGQLVRWTWGFNVLLAPASAYKDEDLGVNGALESGEYAEEEAEHLLHDDSHSDYESGSITPEFRRTYAQSASSESGSSSSDPDIVAQRDQVLANTDFITPTNGNVVVKGPAHLRSHSIGQHDVANGFVMPLKRDSIPRGPKGWWPRLRRSIQRFAQSTGARVSNISSRTFASLPIWLQKGLVTVHRYTSNFLQGLWEFMNPPLWAMLVAIIVASVPQLQHLFFDPGTFVSNSATRAITQSGQVAVPLILVVLGANLARNTLPKSDAQLAEDPRLERKLVIASLISRMLLPTIIMAPLLALTAKYVPVSILDDPIFIIVCFLLTGAPSALQLAQICQINNVYMGAMAKLLFQSYVVWILPSTETTHGLAIPGIRSNCCLSGVAYGVRMRLTFSARDMQEIVSYPHDYAQPPPQPKHKENDHTHSFDSEKAGKKFRASIGAKRLSGRPSIERLASSAKSVPLNPLTNSSISSIISEDAEGPEASQKHRTAYARLSQQVHQWMDQERARRAARKAKKAAAKHAAQDAHMTAPTLTDHNEAPSTERARRDSDLESEGSAALEALANILARSASLRSNEGFPRKPRRLSHSHHRPSAVLKRQSTVTSDTDYFDGAEELVPSCDAVLDNSKTMAYSGGSSSSGEDPATPGSKRREVDAWATFKYEILRITHTLQLKGWRRVPLDQSNEIEVARLSGALTNAVYVVCPPKILPSKKEEAPYPPTPKRPPPKLLLRVYGPQVEHLIDRDAELQILRRLARKRIGPRLLGTFVNGRFEEYFNAQTLRFEDLRVPETSKQIAKRMRELHDGIELLRSEREGGPFVWRNWGKWVDRCEQIVTWLDQQVKNHKGDPSDYRSPGSRQRGFVCGVEWPVFRKMVEKYRKWLVDRYEGLQNINERLVFAHNDAQYGNILRLMPSGESPLLLPKNEHKQLVVIDFEYANANLPGLEFANHFTEWCYNYHGDTPHACNTRYYPTPEEQSRFIRAYITHNPSYKASGASNPPTPQLRPLRHSGSSTALAATAAPSSISAFMLDSRAPPGEKYSYQEVEAQAERETKEETTRLMAETRLWRLANSAQWTAWGIVQANIPGLPDFDKVDGEEKEMENGEGKTDDGEEKGEKKEEGDAALPEQEPEVEEFDYLAYAQDRAMFVWGDAIQLGIVEADELPEEVRARVKLVEY